MTIDLTRLVKPLEWVENPDAGEGGWLGGTASSTLVYHAMGDGWSYHRGMFWRDASTLEAAQAAANADHAARVIAALDADVLGELVEALDAADRMCRLDLSKMTDWDGNMFSQAVYDVAGKIRAAIDQINAATP